MKMINLIFIVLILSGCTHNRYNQFYHPYVDVTTLPNAELIKPGQKPKVLETDNIERDVKILRAKHYLIIGSSSFSGGYEDKRNAAEQAKQIGATIVLINSKNTKTQTTGQRRIFLPNHKDISSSGRVNENSSYSRGDLRGDSVSPTIYGIKAVPIRHYDAVYLVKSTQKVK